MGNFISEWWDDQSGKTASDAAKKASQQQMAFQQKSLDYMQERDALRNQVGDRALSTYSDIFFNPESQQAQIDMAMQSPMYKAMMGGQQIGEDAIMRNASATGGLRSGNTNAALSDYGSQLHNQALNQSYQQQLQGLKGLGGYGQSNPNISNAYSGMGQTQAQGTTAAAQAGMQGSQFLTNLAGAALGGVPGMIGSNIMGGFGNKTQPQQGYNYAPQNYSLGAPNNLFDIRY